MPGSASRVGDQRIPGNSLKPHIQSCSDGTGEERQRVTNETTQRQYKENPPATPTNWGQPLLTSGRT